MKCFAALAAAGVLVAASCFGQDVDTQGLQTLHWRLIGSFRGGRVSAVAGVPGDPNIYYFGTPGGGIWESTDAGRVWEPIFDKARVASIGALAVAPSDSKIIYAGTGEQTPGNGVYKSTDAGKTWTHAGLDQTRFIQAVIVDPHNPDILIAGSNSIGVYVFSHPYPKYDLSTPRGVFKSADGGKTWKQTLDKADSAGVFDMEVDPDDPHVLYASMLIPAPEPSESAVKNTSAASTEKEPEDTSVIYKSTDEGSTWTPLAVKGLPETGRGRLGLAVAPRTGGKRLYGVMNQGFYRSDDGGATWTKSTNDPRIIGNAYFSRLFVDTKNPDILYMAQTSLYRSTDGGHTFEAFVGAPSGDDFHVLWIDPTNPHRMLLGVDQGAILSVDAGKTWSTWYNQPTGQYYHITTDDQFPYRTYAAQQDSGTQSVPSRSDNGEITGHDDTSVGGFEYCYIAPDPLHPQWIYSGGWFGSVVRYDSRTGQIATVFEKGNKYRASQMPPLLFSPHDPHTLYFATQYVMKTTDEGKTWEAISPDLTEWKAPDGAKPVPGAPRPPAIEALAISPVDAGEMWASTSNRLVQLTRDGGAHWQKVTPAGITEPSQILYVEPSHFDAGEAFLTVGTSRQTVPARFLRTRDFGATWQSIVTGLPAEESVLVVREDPARKGLLYAGTLSTVYVSFDDGDHWHPLTLNLPASQVTDIDVHGDDLAISTYGRGLWILDDIAPIRDLTPDLLAQPASLLPPVAAMRVRWDNWEDTPLPIETPSAKNPPDGVLIDYYLKTAHPGAVEITIRDANGNVVRRYTGSMSEPKLTLPNVPEYWFGTTKSVDGSAGLHRFVWDLRYDSPKALPASYYGPILQYTEYTLADHAIPHETPRQQPQGPLVVPGNYTVELSVDGETYRQPLTVKLDPRVHALEEDLEVQGALARRIVTGMNVSYGEYKKLEALTAALDELKKQGKPEAETADLEKQIKAVAEGTHALPGLGPVNRDLGRLLFGIESADQRPSAPQLQAVEEQCSALTNVLALWKHLNDGLAKQNPLNLPVDREVPSTGCTQWRADRL
ncbi:MAG: VPS10 domain-containing protein [Terracidiphilus sp.]